MSLHSANPHYFVKVIMTIYNHLRSCVVQAITLQQLLNPNNNFKYSLSHFKLYSCYHNLLFAVLVCFSFLVNSVQADWRDGFEIPPKEQQNGDENGAFQINKISKSDEESKEGALTYVAAYIDVSTNIKKPISWSIYIEDSAFLKIYIPPFVTELNMYINSAHLAGSQTILSKDFNEYACDDVSAFPPSDKNEPLKFSGKDYDRRCYSKEENECNPQWESQAGSKTLSHKRKDDFINSDSCLVFGFHNYDNPALFQLQSVRVTYTISDLEAFNNWVNIGNNQPPTANFTATPTSGEAPLTVTLNASASTDVDGTISSYEWLSSGQIITPGANSSITFNNPDTYTITLTVTDDQGSKSTDKKKITVSPSTNNKPIALFTMKTDGCCSLTLDASGSSDEDNGINEESYKWLMLSINDSTKVLDIISPCQNQKTCRIFTESLDKDFYMVMLTVSDIKGVSSEPVSKFVYLSCSQDTVVTGDKPVAKFTAVVRKNKVTLDASESCAPEGGVITTYGWKVITPEIPLGEKNLPLYEIPLDSPLGTGNYEIELTVTGNNSLIDSVSHTVTVP